MLRSINVDSEWKTVNASGRNGQIRSDNLIHGVCGRGNNWAMGYYGLESSQEEHILHKTLRSVRKEAERCDQFKGVILFHSLTGGTGAGFGSLVSEEFRDTYPSNYLLCCSIAPYCSGETPLQHYNNILALSTLHQNADGIIVLPNDSFYQNQISASKKKVKDMKVSVWDINHAMAQALAGVFCPTDTLRLEREYLPGSEPWYLVSTLCPKPDTKMILLSHRPCHSTLPADKVPSVTLASNTAHVTDFLQKTLNKAKAMYDNGAYLHWYWRHGASQNDFQNAFESVRGIIENYEECAVIS